MKVIVCNILWRYSARIAGYDLIDAGEYGAGVSRSALDMFPPDQRATNFHYLSLHYNPLLILRIPIFLDID